MALRQILLSRKIEERRKRLEALRAKWTKLEERRRAMTTREAELETAVGEVTEETTDEEREELDAETEQWKQEDAALASEERENQEETGRLEGEIAQLEGELNEMNERAKVATRSAETAREGTRQEEMNPMNTRKKIFGMTIQERTAFVAREDVKNFLTRVREMGRQERAVTGAQLLIPTVVLDLLRENMEAYSKLSKHVRLRPVAGKARQVIMGTTPEAVWTEMCAVLNELTLNFNDVEVDGYMVGGYVSVCRSMLDDSDVNLADEIFEELGKAIGIALDKAILYGAGTKMPLGIVKRLAQTESPSSYPATARTWTDLHTSNVISITAENSTGTKLFQELLAATGAAKDEYSAGGLFWAMNRKTLNTLKAEALNINAAGAIVSGMANELPIIGGAVETLSFIPDNVIIGGFGDLYLLAEREGTMMERSDHARFIQHQAVFKALARYDGLPVIAEGFVAIGIKGATVSASAVTFATDTANAS